MINLSVFHLLTCVAVFMGWMLNPMILHSDSSSTKQWGFDAPEMFPIESQIEYLQSGDLDNDGKMDLIISNPRRSEIVLLFNRTGIESAPDIGTDEASNNNEGSINDLPPDSRFTMDSVIVQSRVKGLLATDLDGDHLPDLITYDAKNKLMVRWNHTEHPWTETVDWRLEGGLTGRRVVQSADLNQDGLVDLLLVGEQWLAMLINQGDRQFEQPQKMRLPIGYTGYTAQDIDGDSASDLIFHVPGREEGFMVSFRRGSSFTTLSQIVAPPLAGVSWLHQKRGDPIHALGISDQRDQVTILELKLSEKKKPGASGIRSMNHFLKFPAFGGVKRGICWSDLNGDYQPDCLAADPDAGLIHVYLSNKHGYWDQPRTFPSLTGIEELVSFDWNGDGVVEVFVLSRDENQVGVSKWNSDNLSLSYPERIPGLSNPLVLTVGEHAQSPTIRKLAVLMDKDNGWTLAQVDHQFQQTSYAFDHKHSGNPERLMSHDMDQDGMLDFILFTPYEQLVCFRKQEEGGTFDYIDLALPGGTWQRGWANQGDLDADGVQDLILPFNNLIRAFKMSPVKGIETPDETSIQWELEVVQQINGPTGNSHLLSGLVVPSSEERSAKVLLLDEAENQVHLALQDTMGVWRIQESLKLFIESGLQLSLLATGEKGSGQRILCQGKQDALVLDFEFAQPELVSLSSVRSETKDARFLQVYAGDFNSDDQLEVFGLESREHAVECMEWGSQNVLEALNRWQVFESRSYRNQGAAFPEPREGLVQDLTGDGRLDFCVMVHDRIILYPQRNSWDKHASGH